MAAVLTEHRAEKIGEPELRRILTQLESISEDKARQLFANATETKNAREPDERPFPTFGTTRRASQLEQTGRKDRIR